MHQTHDPQDQIKTHPRKHIIKTPSSIKIFVHPKKTEFDTQLQPTIKITYTSYLEKYKP